MVQILVGSETEGRPCWTLIISCLHVGSQTQRDKTDKTHHDVWRGLI